MIANIVQLVTQILPQLVELIQLPLLQVLQDHVVIVLLTMYFQVNPVPHVFLKHMPLEVLNVMLNTLMLPQLLELIKMPLLLVLLQEIVIIVLGVMSGYKQEKLLVVLHVMQILILLI